MKWFVYREFHRIQVVDIKHKTKNYQTVGAIKPLQNRRGTKSTLTQIHLVSLIWYRPFKKI